MEGLEILIGYAILYQLAILLVPIFKLITAIVAAKHFKGMAATLMLIGAIGSLLLHFTNLYFDYYYLPRHYSSPNLQYFLYAKIAAGTLINFLYLIGVYLLMKQWLTEKSALKSHSESIEEIKE